MSTIVLFKIDKDMINQAPMFKFLSTCFKQKYSRILATWLAIAYNKKFIYI